MFCCTCDNDGIQQSWKLEAIVRTSRLSLICYHGYLTSLTIVEFVTFLNDCNVSIVIL